MNINYVYSFGLESINYEIFDENTLKINGETYYFDPQFVEYDNIAADGNIIIYYVWDIYRDENNKLYMNAIQGKKENE